MKRKLFSALVLSTLMTQAPISLAMEKEALERPHKIRKIDTLERRLDGLPHDILCLIFNWCDVPAFFALKGTCKKLHDIAKGPRFCLVEDPEALAEQLRGFIDQKNKTFRLDDLLPLMDRTLDVARRLLEAGKNYPVGPIKDPLKQQTRGFLLLLAECAGNQDARPWRDLVKRANPGLGNEVFFHLLPSQGGLDGKRFDSYKLMANFFEFSKKLAQKREKVYMDYGNPGGGPARFRDILKHVSGVPFNEVPQEMDEKTKEMVAFFREKELASCADEVHQIRKNLENKRWTTRDGFNYSLGISMTSPIWYAHCIVEGALNQTLEAEKKKSLCLKLAAIQEEGQKWETAIENYMKIAELSEDRAQKTTYLFKAAFLYEKVNVISNTRADFYYRLAEYLQDKAKSLPYFLKAAGYYERLHNIRGAVSAYRAASCRAQDMTQKRELCLKTISLYHNIGDNKALSSTYLFLADLTQDNAQKEEAAQKAFYFAKIAEFYPNAFLSSLFLSFYAKDTEKWVNERDTLWQKIDKNPENKKAFYATVELLKKIGNDDLADKLETFITQHWPKA